MRFERQAARGGLVYDSSASASGRLSVIDMPPSLVVLVLGFLLSLITTADRGAGWMYKPGDDSDWARPDLDDGSWERLPTTAFAASELPKSGWTGIGWFRLHVRVAGLASGRSLALGLQHWGASEIFVDGRLVQRFGRVGPTTATEQPFNPRGRPVLVTPLDDREHVIAIRLSCAAMADLSSPSARWLAKSGQPIGFVATLSDGNAAIEGYEQQVTRVTGLSLGFGGLFAAFGVLHLLLFAFYPRERGNVFFAAFAFAVTAVMGIDFARQLGHHGLWMEIALMLALPTAGFLYCTSFLGFLYTSTAVAYDRRVLLAYATAWIIALLCYLADPVSRVGDLLTVVLLMLFAVESIRIGATALARGDDGAGIVAVGVLGSLVTPITVALQTAGASVPLYTRSVASRLAFLGLILSASIYLARRVARTNRRLEATIDEVRELSARQLEQERREAELRVQQERERAELRRREKELEDARQLQLSMLPQALPTVPSLDIAAYMKTATEVGGDYYDFHVGDDGTVTIVLGDATGHGLRAGTVVTAAKSLFQAYAGESNLAGLFEKSSRVLEQMNLGSLFMAFQALRIKEGTLRIASAGMPPAAIYRARSGAIEQVTAAGPPLGLPIPWQYEEETYALSPGDAILVMTDGVPERFNTQEEMFGYARTSEFLKPNGASARQIIEQVVQAADAWADGRPQDDDVTVLVIRVLG
jgi:serine phosphatase RsbU (regulator of sigma subunit)